ncbi:hypothetical protein [Gordonia rubripertincta]|uniref:Phage L5-like integrase N-terminal domain-containing protein n=1 Tax=Gordonia rubripertincta TaxID=36822 RepID=A0ABT4MVF2_GORRU|nr:hypothetical protein [Gordonia rubripertincta]MCZ4550985.1 hypothetical protein [Gordonia rubripertincta]
MAGQRAFGSIRKLPSKKFQARYVHGADLARYTAPTTFTAKIDAEGWLAQERKLIENGEWTPRYLLHSPRNRGLRSPDLV